MKALFDRADAYWRFAGTCTQCSHCTEACESLTRAGMSLGQIAKAMLEAQRTATTKEELAMNVAMNGDLVQAVRGCFFCTSCKNTCFAHNDVCDLIYNARVDFQNLGLIERAAWSSVLVDEEWDIFTAYRAIHGIGYVDLVRHKAYEGHEAETGLETAFFPGCSLAAYGPELTREIFQTMDEMTGGSLTMVDSCCGSSLKSAGFFDRAEALCDRNADELVAAGAKELVCVCPGCANDMKKALEKRGIHVEVRLLADWLHERGFQPKHPLPDGPLCLSKSCQDRDGTYLEQTREALRSNVAFYNREFLNSTLTLVAAVTLVCYIMYTVDEQIMQRLGCRYVYMTTIFVLAGILRYLQLTLVEEKSWSPTRILLRDRFLQLCILLWFLSFAIIIYG